jgi:hypothetical protein
MLFQQVAGLRARGGKSPVILHAEPGASHSGSPMPSGRLLRDGGACLTGFRLGSAQIVVQLAKSCRLKGVLARRVPAGMAV